MYLCYVFVYGYQFADFGNWYLHTESVYISISKSNIVQYFRRIIEGEFMGDDTRRPDYPDGGQLGRTKAGLLLWPPGEDHIISVAKATTWLERLFY
jgi:hypothetical protein